MKHLISLLFTLIIIHSQITTSAPNILSQLSACPTNNCCDANTITVQGSATIQATPDQASIQASLSVNADTSAQAISRLTTSVNRIISILTSNQLTADNYQTSSFSVYPNTSYANGVAKVVGQIASQSFQINIPSVSSDGSNIGRLIDSLAVVNGIVINGLSFDVKNKTSAFQRARQLAYQNAQRKAQDYAAGLQLSLGQLRYVVDSVSSAPVVSPANLPIAMAMKVSDDRVATSVNVGTVPINYNL
jgi:uncharacterized protein YggE